MEEEEEEKERGRGRGECHRTILECTWPNWEQADGHQSESLVIDLSVGVGGCVGEGIKISTRTYTIKSKNSTITAAFWPSSRRVHAPGR